MEEEYDCPANYEGTEINPDGQNHQNNDSPQPLTSYSFDGILDFLQNEWAKMNLARSQWSNEKMEYQMKIGYLQNEVKLQENLKRDLVRRIKMLEYALKQERLKSKGTSSTTSLKDDNLVKGQDHHTDNVLNISSNFSENNSTSTFKTNAETILRRTKLTENSGWDSYDKSAACEKDMLDAIGELDMLVSSHMTDIDDDISKEATDEELNDTRLVNKYKEIYRIDSRGGGTIGKNRNLKTTKYLLAKTKNTNISLDNNNQIDNQNGGFLLTDSLDKVDESNISRLNNNNNFDLKNTVPSSSSLGDLASLSLANNENQTTPTDDECLKFNRKKSPPRNIDELEEPSAKCLSTQKNNNTSKNNSLSSSISSCDSIQSVIELEPCVSWAPKYSLRNHYDGVRSVMFHPSENMVISSGEDCTVKVWNLDRTLSGRKSKNLDVEPIYSFRGHLSPILSQLIIPFSQPISVQKINLPPSTNDNGKKDQGTNSPDEKPYIENLPCSHIILSGDLDGHLRTWCLPDDINNSIELFEPFNYNLIGPIHKMADSIWSIIQLESSNLIASISSSCQLSLFSKPSLFTWISEHQTAIAISKPSTAYIKPILNIDLCKTCPEVYGRPTVLLPVDNHNTHSIIVGFTSGDFAQIDCGTGTLTRSFKIDDNGIIDKLSCSPYSPAIVNCMAATNSTGSQFVSGHDDMNIRFWDITRPNPLIKSVKAHKDSITAIATNQSNPSQICSGSHDSLLKIYRTETYECLQEIASHKKKFNEAIHGVAFHPKKMLLASCGADSLVRVFIRGDISSNLSSSQKD